MKKILMLFSLVILGLSLGSCKGEELNIKFKSYKNEVTNKQFYEQFNKALKENYITGTVEREFNQENQFIETKIDNDFEFEYLLENYSSRNIEKKYNLPGQIEKSNSYQYKSINVKSDMDNQLMEMVQNTKEYKDDDGLIKNSEGKETSYFMIKSDNIIEVSPQYLTYSKYSTQYETPFEYAQSKLGDQVLSIETEMQIKITDDEDLICEFYVDDNVFTIVTKEVKEKEVDNFKSNSEVKKVHQLVLDNNSIKYSYESISTLIEEEENCQTTTEYVIQKLINVNKKNLKLKKPKLDSLYNKTIVE